jgi:lysophospholipase L1-like esterase
VLPEAAGPRAGEIGGGPLLRLLIIGDSSAAGVGVAHQDQALAGYLTRTLAREAQVRVRWTLVARSGVTTAQALELAREARPAVAEVAVVVTGVNDVIDRIRPHRAVLARGELVDWLRSAVDARHVVFAPLPPVHRFPALPQPLRAVAGAEARRHDRALAQWAAMRASGSADVSHVPIDLSLGVETMALDGFHPGEPVYRACGEALAYHIATAVLPSFTRSSR